MVSMICASPHLFQSKCPGHLRSSQPVSTAKQSESIMRDNCICYCCQSGQKQVLMLPNPCVPTSPTGPFQNFCPALVSPLRSDSAPKQLKSQQRVVHWCISGNTVMKPPLLPRKQSFPQKVSGLMSASAPVFTSANV